MFFDEFIYDSLHVYVFILSRLLYSSALLVFFLILDLINETVFVFV